jgi:hypothetical protein
MITDDAVRQMSREERAALSRVLAANRAASAASRSE